MRFSPHSVSRLTSVGLAVVLLTLTSFALWAGQATDEAHEQVAALVRSSTALRHALHSLDLANAAHYEYWAEPSRSTARELRSTVDRLGFQLNAIERSRYGLLGQQHEVTALAAVLLPQYQRYRASALQFATANRAGNAARRLQVEHALDPVYAVMERELVAATGNQHSDVVGSLHTLHQRELFVEHAAVFVFSIGLVLLLVCWMLTVRATRREAAGHAAIAYLETAALTDPITGIGNHRAFQEDLGREVARAGRHAHPLTLALLDIDDFKLVNDQQGHAHGDRVLARLAVLLCSRRREDQPFRLGGDEFALILSHAAGDDAKRILEELRRSAERDLLGSTVSIGLSDVSVSGNDLDTLREQAEAALAEAKRAGRNRVVAFTDIRDSVSIYSAAKVQALRQVLDERHMGVAFQPIWDLQRQSIMAYEALARPAPKYGFAGPQEAFDIAAKIGRAHELDAVCRAAILTRATDLPRDALLFINISPHTLDHDMLAGAEFAEQVSGAGLCPSRIVLEVTERETPRLPAMVREADRLRRLGFRIALDDVGSGNTGLEVLRQMPVDFVKIDRSVVAGARADTVDRAVLVAIMAFARQINCFVIAEGIEDEAMLDFVRSVDTVHMLRPCGVNGGQGYHLGRPSERIDWLPEPESATA